LRRPTATIALFVVIWAGTVLARRLAPTARRHLGATIGAQNRADYRRAIREVAAAHGRLSIFIFSDDIRWAHQNAGVFETEGCNVNVIDDEDPLRSFYLMTLCNHFIIANSTFSWWAAWLAKYSVKTVCVPSAWNRGERRPPRDLFPPAWKIVPATAVTEQSFGLSY